MKVSVLSRASNHDVQRVEELTAAHIAPKVGGKDGESFVPALFSTPYAEDINATHLTGLVMDCDGWPEASIAALQGRLLVEGRAFGYYETFSHFNAGRLYRLPDGRFGWTRGGNRYELKKPKTGENPLVDVDGPVEVVTCGRFILAFDKPAPVDLWGSAWPALTAHFTPEGLKVDQSCSNASRLYYFPRHRAGETRAHFWVEGLPLNWEALGPFEAATPRVRVHVAEDDDLPPASAALLAAAEDHVATYRNANPTTSGNGNHDMTVVGKMLRHDWALRFEEALPIAQRHNALTFNPREDHELDDLIRRGKAGKEPFGYKRVPFDRAEEAIKKGAGGPSAAPARETEFSVDLLRAKLGRSKHLLVKKVLNGKPVCGEAKHGGDRSKGAKGKLGLWRTALTEMSNLLAGEAWPAEMLWEVLCPSWVAEADSAEDPKPSREAIESLLAELRESAPGRVAAREVKADLFKAECAAAILSCHPGDPDDTGEWLTPHLDDGGSPIATHNTATAVAALRLSSAWSGFGFDRFTQRLFFRGEQIDADIAATKVLNWLSERGLYGAGGMKDLIGMVARENSFDSLVDFYDALPTWDGKDRLGSFDRVYLHAEDPNLFTSEACRRWFLSLVARAYAPGCQVDTALILRGTRQGERKSTFFASLPFYLDFKFGRTEDEDTRNLIGRHVVEFSELVALKMKEREHAKNFLTKLTDKVRRMRADDSNQIERRGVFCGTTNLDSFLDDPTGHRRYWPLTVGAVEYLKLREDLPQILAQARTLWMEGEDHCPRKARCLKHRWFIDEDEPELFQLQKDATHSRTEESQTQQMIQEALVALAPRDRPSAITARWVFLNVIDLAAKRTDRSAQREVSEALRALCGPEKRRAGGKVVSRHYKVPDVILHAPQQKSAKQGVYDYVHSVPAEEASS